MLHHNYVTTDVSASSTYTDTQGDGHRQAAEGRTASRLPSSTQTHHSTDSTQRGLATDCVRTAIYRYIVLE